MFKICEKGFKSNVRWTCLMDSKAHVSFIRCPFSLILPSAIQRTRPPWRGPRRPAGGSRRALRRGGRPGGGGGDGRRRAETSSCFGFKCQMLQVSPTFLGGLSEMAAVLPFVWTSEMGVLECFPGGPMAGNGPPAKRRSIGTNSQLQMPTRRSRPVRSISDK